MQKLKLGQIDGARTKDSQSLVTLDELTHIAKTPLTKNNTYYLMANIDKYIILDVEKTASDELKQRALKLPFLYGERSMSGLGYHFIFPLPKNFAKYPHIPARTKMQSKKGDYEILLNHFITFTRDIIEPPENPEGSIEDIFEELALAHPPIIRNKINITKSRPEDIIAYDYIYPKLSIRPYKKTLADFYDDYSKFEYGATAYYHARMVKLTQTKLFKSKFPNFTENDAFHILSDFMDEQLPYRPKHSEERQGLPWIQYLVSDIMKRNKPPKETTS